MKYSHTGDAVVNHPTHYTSHPSGVECIQVTEHMNFNLGNAVKYIWRASLKGKQRQDLEKSRWYIQRELDRLDTEEIEAVRGRELRAGDRIRNARMGQPYHCEVAQRCDVASDYERDNPDWVHEDGTKILNGKVTK